MYLVELGAGKDELYRSTEELVAAIRRGEIGPQSRIYHRSSSKWLPITVHPEFRRYASERANGRPPRKQWTFLRDPSAERAESAEASASDTLITAPQPTRGWRRVLGSAFRRLAHS
jgi:hypothetical protein